MRGIFKRLFALLWVLMVLSFPLSIMGGTTPEQAGSALSIIVIIVLPIQWVLAGKLNPLDLFRRDKKE